MFAGLLDAAAGVFHALAATLAAAVGLSGAAPPPPLLDAACDGRLVLRQDKTVASDELTEISGVVESRTRTGVLWVHNDSGIPHASLRSASTGARSGRSGLRVFRRATGRTSPPGRAPSQGGAICT